MKRKRENVTIENARIGFRNFSGKAGKYNAEGVRSFCVFLDNDYAKILERDGWNISWLTPRDDQEDMQAIVRVSVRFDNYPPKVVLMSSKGQSILDEHSVNILDWAEIANVDLTLNPSEWTMYPGKPNEKHGVKVYLKSIWVTIVEDALEKKYCDTPDSATDSIGGCGHCEACDGSCGHNHLN
jgi:hypothetical protein